MGPVRRSHNWPADTISLCIGRSKVNDATNYHPRYCIYRNSRSSSLQPSDSSIIIGTRDLLPLPNPCKRSIRIRLRRTQETSLSGTASTAAPVHQVCSLRRFEFEFEFELKDPVPLQLQEPHPLCGKSSPLSLLLALQSELETTAQLLQFASYSSTLFHLRHICLSSHI